MPSRRNRIKESIAETPDQQEIAPLGSGRPTAHLFSSSYAHCGRLLPTDWESLSAYYDGSHVRRTHKIARFLRLELILTALLLVCCSTSRALNPELDVSQYAHTAWKVRDGFTQGAILAIAQSPDGYLWLGTEFGLYRFDGVHAVLWQPPAGQDLPSHYVHSLLFARDGTLWIGTNKGIASWKGGKLMRYSELSGQMIHSLYEDREGTIWSSGEEEFSAPTICAISESGVHCYGEDGSLSGGGWIVSLFEDRKGILWAVAKTGIWKWKPGPPQFYPLPIGADVLDGVVEDDSGKLLVGLEGGIRRFFNGKIETYSLPSWVRPFSTRTMVNDREGGVWIAAYHAGLVHIHHGRVDTFTQSDGLSSDEVVAIFEDRENNLWVSTNDGLDRFRDTAVATLSLKQGLSNSLARSVLAGKDGSVWVATPAGLDRWRDGRIATYDKRDGRLDGLTPTSLFQDSGGRIWVSTAREIGFLEENRFVSVTSTSDGRLLDIAEDSAENIWAADQQGGLVHLRGSKLVERIPWASLGHKDFALSLATDPLRDGLWIGFYGGGISYFADGHIQKTYTATDGLGAGSVTNLRMEKDGTLWAATESGLSRMTNGHFITLARESGLPCNPIHWMMRDDDGSIWLDTPCGLLRLARSEIDAWIAAAGRNQAAKQIVHPTVFDNSDGMRVHEFSYHAYSPSVTESLDGKIWFSPQDGVSVIDPRHLPFNKLPPPVHIEQITADAKSYDAYSGLPLPPLARAVTIRYTALSLAVPEKIRFRYKLDGQDSDWREVVNERQVQYTNLGPGHYTFRVVASNNDGVWNGAGAILGFSIAPAYYQTTWFRFCCAVIVLLLFWGAYQLRVHQLERQFAIGIEARVNERTRIARDLHDTLLQSFNALLIRLQTVGNVLPAHPDEAKRRLDLAIDQASNAITEGRDTLFELRSSGSTAIDLDRAISDFARELLSGSTSEPAPEVHVKVEGTPTPLNPIVRDEVFRIVTEALRNAIRHANAHRIEVEIRYDQHYLRLRIGDNGTGIDEGILDRDHNAGRWGLRGMRERAKLVGGTLEVWSQIDSGTEIELNIPAAMIYAKSASARRSVLSRFRNG